jgi:hypothetical protein
LIDLVVFGDRHRRKWVKIIGQGRRGAKSKKGIRTFKDELKKKKKGMIFLTSF